MIQTVQAVQFHRSVGTGRTKPIFCGCESQEGGPADDYVVKLRGGNERGVTALACELVASRLAGYFGIPVPEPALVWLDPIFAELVSANQPAMAHILAASVGLNFGSRQLKDVMTWPVELASPAPDTVR